MNRSTQMVILGSVSVAVLILGTIWGFVIYKYVINPKKQTDAELTVAPTNPVPPRSTARTVEMDDPMDEPDPMPIVKAKTNPTPPKKKSIVPAPPPVMTLAAALAIAPSKFEAAEIQPLQDCIEQVSGGLVRNDLFRVGALVDYDGLQRRIASAYYGDGRGFTDPIKLRDVLKEKTPFAMQTTLTMDASDGKIKHVRWLKEDRSAAFVMLRSRILRPGGRAYLVGWWLTKGPDGWRVTDWENLDLGISFASTGGYNIADNFENSDLGSPWSGSFEEINNALSELMRNTANIRFAGQVLNQQDNIALPARMDAQKKLLRGIVWLGQQRYTDSIEAFREALRRSPDTIKAHYYLALCHNELNNFAAALEDAKKASEYLVDEAEVLFQLGRAQAGLKQTETAAATFRRSLDATPGYGPALNGLRQVLPDDKKKELITQFARAPNKRALYEYLMTFARRDGDAVGAVIFATGMPASEQAFADREATGVFVNKLRGTEGVATFQRVLPYLTDPKRRAVYRLAFLTEMNFQNRGVEGYLAIPDEDAEAAFAQMQDALFEAAEQPLPGSDPINQFKELLTAHRKRKPNDPWLHFAEGQLAINRRDYTAAENHFANGMKAKLDAAALERFRKARVFCAFRAGQGLYAYATIGPRASTFVQLARLFAAERDVKGLETIVAQHKAAVPGERELPFWEGEIAFLKGENSTVVTKMRQYKLNAPVGDKLAEQAVDRTVRAMVKLKRFEDAKTEYESWFEADKSTILNAVMVAAFGNVEQTAKTIEDLVDSGVTLAAIYADVELGELLRGKQLAEVAKKFPQPAEILDIEPRTE